jgi:hypothetical protein
MQGDALTLRFRLCYRRFVLTPFTLSQSSRYQSYWWWYACAEEANG